jgi:hypothetical protein
MKLCIIILTTFIAMVMHSDRFICNKRLPSNKTAPDVDRFLHRSVRLLSDKKVDRHRMIKMEAP